MTNNTGGQTAIELLGLHSPAFQLKSGTEQLKSSEHFFSRTSQRTDDIVRASHGCSPQLLKYISETVTRANITLETGGGWSTCVFAACAKKHICVNPDITANDLIRSFLQEHSVGIGELVFINDTSDMALPVLDKSCQIDFALIDGNHSYPIPILDWHYIDLHLKAGGIVLIDDTQIKSVGVLCDFLSTEESYNKITEIGTTAVYKKIADDRVWGWSDQMINKAKNQFLRRIFR